MRRAAHTLLLCLACLCLGPLTGTAGAAPSIESSALSPSDSQAGAHADLDIWVALKDPGEPEAAKDLLIDLPPGYFLYPSLQVRCTPAQFGGSECPVDSQVGVVTVHGSYEGNPEFELGTAPVHLLAPEGGGTRLGFVVPTAEVPVEAPVTASLGGEYGLELALRNLPQSTPLRSLALTLWGVPADPVHDAERGGPASAPAAPFTRNPTSCGPGKALSVEVDSYQDPGDFASASGSTSSMVGCGKLAFHPALEVGLTSSQASAQAGLNLAVEIPGDLSPGGRSSSDAGEIFLALPPELQLDEEALPSPPAPLGSFSATVLGVEAPFAGTALFLGPFSLSTYRLALIGSAGGIQLALPALLEFDAAEGSWAVRLPSLPQLPFEELELKLGNAAGPFIAPPECGTFEAASEMI
ncbi:MAG: hypothetical protein M3Y75_02175, partial [Actinomycetota bacterium]|nr:hypothetical protein [Actinomycetota bacterium]